MEDWWLMVRMSRIGGKTFWEKFTQKAPGCAGLERAVPGIFVFGIFGNAANDEFAEPALDHEGGEVKWVFFPFEERGGIVEIAHEGKRREVRSSAFALLRRDKSAFGLLRGDR